MSIPRQSWFKGLIRAAVREEDGQIIPWVLFMMFFFLGMCALSVDVGHALLVQRQLQASTDAAALAAAQRLDYTDYTDYATNYSAAAGKYNQYSEYSGTPTITPYCSPTVAGAGFGIPCTSTSPNAVRVLETAVVPMFFTQYIGIPTITVSSAAYASKGATPLPFNVALVIDTTPSMDNTDTSCHDENNVTIKVNGKYATQLQCASLGVQQLLTGLAPSVDYISMFTFPAITTSSTSSETDCSASTKPYVTPYTFPSKDATSLSNVSYSGYVYSGSSTKKSGSYTSSYQVVNYSTDYRSSDKSTDISTTSALANAVGVGSSSNCTGMQSGYNDTYYAAAIYAAQASLIAQSTSRYAQTGIQSTNAIIILSDGDATAKVSTATTTKKQNGKTTTIDTGVSDSSTFSPGSNDMVTSSSESGVYANSSGVYPSWIGQCSQGIDAAQYATSQGTIVFSIAYGSPTSGCNSDVPPSPNKISYTYNITHPNITPCEAMQYMSSGWPNNKVHFFSDATVNGSNSGCQAADQNQSTSSLNGIFKAIRGQMSTSRLIPPEPVS